MRNTAVIALAAIFSVCSLSAAAKGPDTVASRIAAQNALFEQQYESDLKRHPERATAVGDYRYNDQLDDYSPAAYELQHALDEDFLGRLDAISTTGFPDQDRLSHEVMQRALYSEQLGKEVGFYQDPVSDYGRLSSELFRAVRLVVDTGIHSEGWSRDQVVEFFRKYQPVDEPTIQSETDRYIAWPAQALSYKLGQLKFRELRDRAQKQLGSKFDIRSFHDEMLNGGVLPLDLLDARTNSWIQAQKTGVKTASN